MAWRRASGLEKKRTWLISVMFESRALSDKLDIGLYGKREVKDDFGLSNQVDVSIINRDEQD